MLLGDTHVVETIGEAFGERPQPGRVAHRRRDRGDVVALLADRDDLIGEHRGPGTPGRGPRMPGDRVETAGLVHLVGDVVLGRRVAVALAGDAVHNHRAVEAARKPERALEVVDAVPVDRAEVLQPQVLEHALRLKQVLDAALHPVQRIEDRRADHRRAVEGAAHGAEHPFITRTQAQRRQVTGKSADRG